MNLLPGHATCVHYSPDMTLRRLKHIYVLAALNYYAGNVTVTARMLGITKSTVYAYIHKGAK